MKKKLTVTKPNSIAEARGTMNKAFLDIMDISLQKAVADIQNPDTLRYKIDVKEYQDKFGLKFDSNAFKKLRNSAKSALKTSSLITIEIDLGHEVDFFVFQEIEYIRESGTLNVMFSERFKKTLIDLLMRRGMKIYYSLPDTLQMNSEYSKKLYPILLERVNKKSGDGMRFSASGTLQGKMFDSIFSIDEFKVLLNIPKSYKTSNIKDTCHLVVAEIEAYTPYHATVAYNEQKAMRGRPKTTHICWTMSKKARKTPETNDRLESLTLMITDTAKIAGFTLNEKDVMAVAKSAEKFGLNDAEIKRRILYVGKNTKFIKNQVGYLIFALSPKYEEGKERSKNLFTNIEKHNDIDYDALTLELMKGWLEK